MPGRFPHPTSAGWGVLVLAVVGWGTGLTLRWTELLVVGASATLALLVGLVSVAVPRRVEAVVEGRPTRTQVGSETSVRLGVRTRLLPVLSPMVQVEGDVASQMLRLRTLWPGRTRVETFPHTAERRGVFTLGPVRHLRSDSLGLFRATRAWGETSTMWVRPRVVVPESFSLGGVFDLEGPASDQMSQSDLAFHALREYVAGDDLRRVHWRSSAKADTLLVRQYVESRSLRATVVVDDDAGAYASDGEFETAVSVAASLALRALADGFDVELACGDRTSTPSGPEAMLDDTCAWTTSSVVGLDVGSRSSQLARRGTTVGVGIVVSGSTADLERLLEAAASFGGDAQRIVVRVDAEAAGAVRVSHGVRVLEIARLEQLPRLAAWVAT